MARISKESVFAVSIVVCKGYDYFKSGRFMKIMQKQTTGCFLQFSVHTNRKKNIFSINKRQSVK